MYRGNWPVAPIQFFHVLAPRRWIELRFQQLSISNRDPALVFQSSLFGLECELLAFRATMSHKGSITVKPERGPNRA
jgi:hypothetical protein